MTISVTTVLSLGGDWALASNIRELKMETFSGRRRPSWQRKPGTEAAVASRQPLIRRIPKRKIWLHIKNYENKYLLCRQNVSDEEFLVLGENYESKNPDFPRDSYDPFTPRNMRDAAECQAEFRVEKKK